MEGAGDKKFSAPRKGRLNALNQVCVVMTMLVHTGVKYFVKKCVCVSVCVGVGVGMCGCVSVQFL